jgi:hypothetical protein
MNANLRLIESSGESVSRRYLCKRNPLLAIHRKANTHSVRLLMQIHRSRASSRTSPWESFHTQRFGETQGTRRGTINTIGNAFLPPVKAHSRVKLSLITRTRGPESSRKDIDRSSSDASRSCYTSGHAPRMISRLVCRVRCTVCLSVVFIKRKPESAAGEPILAPCRFSRTFTISS